MSAEDVAGSHSSYTNVPDYQKMLQNHPHNTSGWKTIVTQDGGQVLTPSPIVHHPGPPLSPTQARRQFPHAEKFHDRRSYNPERYGLVAGQSLYSNTYLTTEFQMPVKEDAIKYLSHTGQETAAYPSQHGYSSGTHVYNAEKLQEFDEYDTEYRYPMQTPPARAYVKTDVFRTPPISRTSLNEFYDLPGERCVSADGMAPAAGSGSMSGDLRHWQQQHQEQLLHQHIETQALYDKPANTSLDGLFQQLTLKEEDPTRWEPVRRAADNIIREKNMIIDKLKNRILELEDDNRVYETKLRHALTSKEDKDYVLQMKVQELQHKHGAMKADFIDLRSKKNKEIDDLEIKLGAAEHEIIQLRNSLRQKDTGSEELQSRILHIQHQADEWRSKFIDMKENHQGMKKKLDSLERYLSDLPTVEESAQTAEELTLLRKERAQQKIRVEELEGKVMQAKKVSVSRDFKIKELEENELRLSNRAEEVTKELETLRSDGSGAELFRVQEELEETREERERLAIDLEKAKKLLETTHRRLCHADLKHQNELRQLTERVDQEGESVTVLRQEISSKDGQIENMRKAMKELGNQNQDLMEQNLIMKEQLQHFELQCTDENMKLQRCFMRELGLCFSELQSLVQICTQRASGEDPDMSALLGIKGSGVETDDESKASEGLTIKHWLTKVGELRGEVDKLRGIMCNKYAEEMGDNLNCAQQ